MIKRLILLCTILLCADCSYSNSIAIFQYGNANVVSKVVIDENDILVSFNGHKLFVCFDLSLNKKWGFSLERGNSDFYYQNDTLTIISSADQNNKRMHYRYIVGNSKLPISECDVALPTGTNGVYFLSSDSYFVFGETFAFQKARCNELKKNEIQGVDWLQITPFQKIGEKIVGYVSDSKCKLACRAEIAGALQLIDVSEEFAALKWRINSVICFQDTIFAISQRKNNRSFYTFRKYNNLSQEIGTLPVAQNDILETFDWTRRLLVLNDPIKKNLTIVKQ